MAAAGSPCGACRPAAGEAVIRRVFILAVAFTGVLAAQEHPDRSKPPALTPPQSLTLPPIQKFTLSNGIRVWAVETHEVPIVQVSLVVRAGASDDPAGQ